MILLCKDCEFYEPEKGFMKLHNFYCTHQEVIKTDLVNGYVIRPECKNVRAGKCGHEGSLFKRKK